MIWSEMLEDLLTQKTLSFGEPWRLSKTALGIVVPIVRVKGGAQRQYYVVEEVQDKIQLEDSGEIDVVLVKTTADKPVFMRGGTVLKGGTQPRAMTHGSVLFPESEEELTTERVPRPQLPSTRRTSVRQRRIRSSPRRGKGYGRRKGACVARSKGIRRGASFGYQGLAPQKIRYQLSRGNQQSVWNAVSSHIAMHATSLDLDSAGRIGSNDDLASFMGVSEDISAFKDHIKDLLAKIPGDLDGQVGIVIFDLDGVVGVELFDHEDSWGAFSKSVTRSYTDILTKEQGKADLFELKMDKVNEYIITFLERAELLQPQSIFQEKDAETFSLNGDIVGEYTNLYGNMIHLILTRKEQSEERQGIPRRRGVISPIPNEPLGETREITVPSTTVAPQTYGDYSTHQSPIWEDLFQKRKGAKQLFTHLSEEPKTWSFLAENINVSSRTLSKLTKSTMQQGLVKKKLRENGRVVYSLSE